MPIKYIKDGFKPEEENIRTLLSIRRFRYVRTAIISPGYPISFPDNYWVGVKKLNLPIYKEYTNGRYFPPI